MAELRNRGNGSWQVTLYNGYTPDGKHRRISRTIKVDPNKTENAQRKIVEKEAAKIQADYDRHLLTDAKKVKLSELADDYLKSKNINVTTKQGYLVLLNGRILPKLGNCYIQDLTVRDLQKFFNDLKNDKPFSNRAKGETLSGNAQHHYFTLLRALLNFAVKTQIITVSPMNGIDAPKKEVAETEVLEPEDCAALLEALDKMPDPMWRAYFYMALYSCCRPGELTALCWGDITGNTVNIAHGTAYTKEEGTFRTDQPKNSKSIRKITLPPEVMKVLGEWRKAQLALRLQFGSCWPEGNAVFTGPEGNRIHIGSPTKKWAKFCKENGLKQVKLYSLRHTGASLLIQSGLDVRTVSARLGHSQTSTTLNIYSHQFASAQEAATNAISEALKNARRKAE